MNYSNKSLIFLFSFILLAFFAVAHDDQVDDGADIHEHIVDYSLKIVWWSAIIITLAIIISMKYKGKNNGIKATLFTIIAIASIGSTAFLIGSTIYLNAISETGGPVHWHVDFEFWNCGERLDMLDPTGLSNKVGSSVFHEHNDDRIHVEGVVVKKPHVDLHNFFRVIGGELTNNAMILPTNDGMVTATNGDRCNGQPGELQAWLYRVENPDDHKNWDYTVTKLDNFADYIMAPYSNVPPGDCLILEFDVPKENTEHVCETYKVPISKGELVRIN